MFSKILVTIGLLSLSILSLNGCSYVDEKKDELSKFSTQKQEEVKSQIQNKIDSKIDEVADQAREKAKEQMRITGNNGISGNTETSTEIDSDIELSDIP